MTKREYIRRAQRRVAQAEADCHATILRAFDRCLRVLNRELTEMRIRKDREDRRKNWKHPITETDGHVDN